MARLGLRDSARKTLKEEVEVLKKQIDDLPEKDRENL